MADSASGSNPNRSSSDGVSPDELPQLAHDMRNALSPLRTSLALLQLPQVGDETKTEARDVMLRQIDRLAQLIDRLAPPGVRATRAAAPLASVPSTSPGCRVLLVDDNRLFLESGAALLAAEGYEVRTASDGAEAIETARDWRPRVALVDLQMRGVGGLDAARQLRAEHPREALALLMMSGVALTEPWLEHARAAGFDDCIEKTAPPEEWLALLRRVVQPK